MEDGGKPALCILVASGHLSGPARHRPGVLLRKGLCVTGVRPAASPPGSFMGMECI